MERKKRSCPQRAFDNLLEVTDTRKEDVKARKDDLREVIECHQRWGGAKPSRALVLAEHTKYVEVRKEELQKLLQAHGRICGKGEHWRVAMSWKGKAITWERVGL